MTLVTTTNTTNVPTGAAEHQQQENAAQPILGKFATQEDLIAAYQELEAKVGQPQQQETTGEQPQVQQQTQTQEDPGDAAAKTALAAAGIDFEALSTEFATDGQLSAETTDKLLKAGFTQDVIDGYIEGAVARAEKIEQELYGQYGGFEKIEEALAWAGANLSKEDGDALDRQFAAKDKATIKAGVDALMARFTAANPPAPKLSMGGTAPTSSVKAFNSQAEMSKMVQDPRYGRDPAYMEDYNKRLMATDFAKLR